MFISSLKKVFSVDSSVRHFILQRFTALVLVPLILWLVLSIALVPSADYASMVAWVKHPLNMIILVLMIVMGFYHAALGLEVIIEDYVSTQPKQKTLVIVEKTLCLFFAVMALYALFSIG